MNPAAQWYFESQALYEILRKDGAHNIFTLDSLNKNQFVYTLGDTADSIFFVKKGRIKIFYYTENKLEIVKAILSTGEIFGELALAGENKRTDNAQALGDNTSIYRFPISAISDIMLKQPAVSSRMVKLIGLRMLKVERKIELVSLKDARQRVIAFLRDAAEWKGKKVGTETLIETPLRQSDLAKLVGISRQMLAQVLNDLKRENLIYFDRKRILIRDLTRFH